MHYIVCVDAIARAAGGAAWGVSLFDGGGALVFRGGGVAPAEEPLGDLVARVERLALAHAGPGVTSWDTLVGPDIADHVADYPRGPLALLSYATAEAYSFRVGH